MCVIRRKIGLAIVNPKMKQDHHRGGSEMLNDQLRDLMQQQRAVFRKKPQEQQATIRIRPKNIVSMDFAL